MTQKILAALNLLDVDNDEQWTTAGLPRIDVLEQLTGITLSRPEITKAAPRFTRTNPLLSEGEIAKDENEIKFTSFDGREQTTPSSDDTVQDGAEQPEIAEPVLVEPDGPTELVTRFDEITRLLADATDLKKKIDEDVKQLIAEQNMLYPHVKKEAFSNDANQKAISTYIANQNKQRFERAVRSQKVLSQLDGYVSLKAPIDSAMARKTKRGTGRPSRPLMGS